MRRRGFIAGFGGVMAWPTVVYGQQTPRVRRIGILFGGGEATYRPRLITLQDTLARSGWRTGQNLHIDVRWGGDGPEAIYANARELVSLSPEVILVGPTNALRPMQAATRQIPLVFVLVSDPLGQGIVDSLARPTGNATGFSNLEFSMIGKWLDILKEMVPGVSRVGLMISTSNASSPGWYRVFDSLAPKLGIEPIAAPVRNIEDIDRVVQTIAQRLGGALIVPGDSFVQRPDVQQHIVSIAAKLKVPVLHSTPEYVTDGGLASYGIDQVEQFRQAAAYVDRILRGEKPSDLPVQQPTRFKFAINLKIAKALGLTMPLSLQVAADEVIE